MSSLQTIDPEIYYAIRQEIKRQRDGIELIASENIASKAVLEALGSPLTNKYSEGYPKKRYYGGNEWIDVCELLAMKRAKQLFHAEHVNVQPHSGSQANMAAYMALLKPGDTILAMDLAHGGHLTHGSPVNFSGSMYHVVFYGVSRKDHRIDYAEVSEKAKKEKPKLLLAGASAYPRIIDFEKMKVIADMARAYFVADIAHIAGLVVAGLHPDPIPLADVVTTTTHKTLRGPRGGMICSKRDDRFQSLYHPDSKKNLAARIDSAIFPGIQGGPLDHAIAAKAVAFHEALQPSFRLTQEHTVKNAKHLANILLENGLELVSGGTDNHLLLIDLTRLGIGGRSAVDLLDRAGIYTNKNMIPFDQRKPTDPSGLRLGTPAVTTRGMKEREMTVIGNAIAAILKHPHDLTLHQTIASEMRSLAQSFPLEYS